MAKDDPYFRLRIPEELKLLIEKSAAENNRSATAEIISRLEKSYQGPDEVALKLAYLEESARWAAADIERLESLIKSLDEQINPRI